MSRPTIIGIAGSIASGKDTLAAYLRDAHGYSWISTSDIVRDESIKRHNSIERPDLHETAMYLRNAFGPGILCQKAIEAYTEQKLTNGLVISGIRTLGEMKTITSSGGIIVYTDADVLVRHNRVKARHRDSESSMTMEQFIQRGLTEWYTGPTDADFNERDIKKYAENTGMILFNDGDMDAFYADVSRRLGLV